MNEIPGIQEELRRQRERYEARQRERQTPEARAERVRSRHAHAGLARSEALQLARGSFPRLFAKRDGRLLDLRPGQQVLRYTSATTAVVEGTAGGDGAGLVESQQPLRARDDTGALAPVDLELQAVAGGWEPSVPAVPITLGERADAALSFPGEFTLGLGAASVSGTRSGNDVFFAGVARDTDAWWAPTPAGAQLAIQLRSEDAPEQLRLELREAPGVVPVVRTRPGGDVVDFERNGARIGSMSEPIAFDAGGEPVKITTRVDGNQIVLSVPHRGLDLLYPVAVDPRIENQDSWKWGGTSNNAGWQYQSIGGTCTEGWTTWYAGTGYYIFHHRDRWYDVHNFCEYLYRAPTPYSYIYRADFFHVRHDGSPSASQTSTTQGMFSTTQWGHQHFWTQGWSFDGAGTYWTVCEGGNLEWWACDEAVDFERSRGNYVHSNIASTATGWPSGDGILYLGGAIIYMSDPEKPTLAEWTPAPSGWVRETPAGPKNGVNQAFVRVEDRGLGMWGVWMDVPGLPRQYSSKWGGCTGVQSSRCDDFREHTFSYAGMSEGVQTVTVTGSDVLGQEQSFTKTLKIDRTAPAAATISGVAQNELLRARSYTITASGSDAVSGMQSIAMKFDGQQKAINTSCPAGANQACSVTWTLNGADPALAAGNHTVEAVSTDLAGNVRSTTRTVRVERTAPSGLTLEGSLKPEDGVWVAYGAQDLYVHAEDSETGATHAQLLVDGAVAQQSPEVACPGGGCALDHEFALDTTTLAAGQHQLSVRVFDGAGNSTTSAPWQVRLERDAPTLALSGPLVNAAGQPLVRGQSYTVQAAASDPTPVISQSGLGRIEFRVDEDQVKVAEQACPVGGCALQSSYSFVVNDWDAGAHEVTVVATDLAGNEVTRSMTINTASPAAPACGPAPTPENVVDPNAEAPSAVRTSLENTFPRAFQARSAVLYDDLSLQPALDASVQGVLNVTGAIDPVKISTTSAAPRITLHSDRQPICLTPTSVSSQASAPTAPINATATLFANSLPDVDTVLRPTLVGIEAVEQFRGPLAPRTVSWHVDIPAGQQLRAMPDGSVALVKPVPPGSGPFPPMGGIPDPPALAAQETAVTNSAQQWSHMSDARERLDQAVPEEIIAVLTKPWARDAAGQPIATSLAVQGSTVSMTVEHLTGSVSYPIVAHRQMASAESVDEAQALRDDADTASYTDAQLDDTTEPPDAQADGETSHPGPRDPNFTEPEDWGGDPSGFASEDDSPEGDGVAAVAQPNAAVSSAEATRLASMRMGLTESDPAVLFSPNRFQSPRRIRPVVPLRVLQMRGSANQVESERANKWRRFYHVAKAPKLPDEQSCTSGLAQNEYGRKSPHEKNCGVATDISIQFFDTDPAKPPSPKRYKRHLVDFLNAYPRITRHLGAWNEPQLNRNPTRKHPRRAAQFWIAAQQACHPKGSKIRCKHVVAGEFAGGRKSVRFDEDGEKKSYEKVYRDYLYSRLAGRYRKLHKPRVWGFHAYEDVHRRELLRKLDASQEATGAPLADDTPIVDRFHRQHVKGAYPDANLWITAIGAPYRLKCPDAKYPGYCRAAGHRVVLLGTRRQLDGLRFVLRRIARYSEMKALYYYALHDVVNAAGYPAQPVPPGRVQADYEGRCDNASTSSVRPCRNLDRGLVGSDADADMPADKVDDKSGGARSAEGARRPVYCLIQHQMLRPPAC
jgi:hypothetical protein